MFHHQLDRKVSFSTAFNWLVLSFLAGSVNAGGALACHRFVTHVTGFATLAGIDLAHQRWTSAVGMFTVPLFFLFGVMISAYFIDRRIHLKRSPLYSFVMLLVALCLSAAAVGGIYDFFGPFGAMVDIKKDYILLCLLCMASGLQNAAITSASGATVRTTHLTGLTTDLGIGIVRAFYSQEDKNFRVQARRANRLRVCSLFAFVLGGAAGAFLFLEVAYLGFFMPAGIALYAAFQELHHHTHKELEEAAENLKDLP